MWERGTVAILLSLPSSEKLISLPLFLGANAWRAGDKTRLPRVELMQFIINKNTFLISHIRYPLNLREHELGNIGQPQI